MNIENILKIRKSCRTYSNRKITSDIIDKIIWAGNRAPYASGGPRRQILAIRNKDLKREMKKACFNQPYIEQCDTLFIVCGLDIETKLKSGHPKYVHDCNASNMCMDLMAVSMGLSTCWIGHFKPEEVKKIIKCQGRPTIILIVGYEP